MVIEPAELTTKRERDLLRRLLREYNEQPDQRARIAAEIERRFRRPLAILVLDSSGFSRSVRTVGIVHYLALLERLAQVAGPCIERSGGRVLHTEADNIFAAFSTATDATQCAASILRELARVNESLPENEQIYVSMGIGYGEVLVVDNETPYGDEMNLACKLGEDLARQEEVLLTPAAYAALESPPWQFEPIDFSISGIELTAYRLVSR